MILANFRAVSAAVLQGKVSRKRSAVFPQTPVSYSIPEPGVRLAAVGQDSSKGGAVETGCRDLCDVTC